MGQIFISHAEEDAAIALEIAANLERANLTTWYYERDSVPGPSYLDQVSEAIEQCEAIVLLVSADSLKSHQVDGEVMLAWEVKRNLVPVLHGVTHKDLETNRRWRMAVGTAVAISIPDGGPMTIIDRLTNGIRKLGIVPAPDELLLGSARPAVTAAEIPSKNSLTLFVPTEVEPDTTARVHVWIHPTDQATEISSISEQFEEAGTSNLTIPIMDDVVLAGALLQIDLRVGDLSVQSPTAEVNWQSRPLVRVFRISVPAKELPSTEVGQATLFLGEISIALLKFKLKIRGTGPLAEELSPTRPVRKVYLSYSHQDREEVLRRAQMLSLAGLQLQMDMLSLQAGEVWADQLRRMIDEADVFILFWSENARRSRWVEDEWRYVLKTKGPEHIVPIALEHPLPPPPPELAMLHFRSSLAYFQ
jgi:hypothetical protein